MPLEKKLLEKAVREKYTFKPYSHGYKTTYTREEKILKKALKGLGPMIEHVGSTAIHGMGGKGIIDVLVFVPKKNMARSRRAIEKKAKFRYNANWRKKRFFFSKYYLQGKKVRMVHIHLTAEGSQFHKLIALVDFLKRNKGERKKYEKLKRRASELYWADGEKYRKFKKKFLSRIAKKAVLEFNKKHGD